MQLPARGRLVDVHLARPSRPGPGVVILHSAWGLLRDYLEACERLAAAGFVVAAPDLFSGRTAASWAEAERLARENPSSRLAPAVRAIVEWLHRQPEVLPKRAGLVGFSLGGATALRVAAGGVGDAVVTFYGTPSGVEFPTLRVPVLGHFADIDPYEPADAVSAFFEKLRRHGTAVSLMTYPGTRHCFWEASLDTYDRKAAQEAWDTTLAFLRRHLTAPDSR